MYINFKTLTMKGKLVILLIAQAIVFTSCFTKEVNQAAPKTADPDDLVVKYFQNRGPESDKTVHYETIQPSENTENKIFTDLAENKKINVKDDVISESKQEKTKKKIGYTEPEFALKKSERSETKIAEKPVSETTQEPEKKTEIIPEQDFKVVSGSFQIKQNAERFVNTLKASGYEETYYQYADNGFYRVIVKVLPQEQEARSYLSEYREKDQKYNRAWLLYKKLKEDEQLALTKLLR
jgi:cell division protein FtsN